MLAEINVPCPACGAFPPPAEWVERNIINLVCCGTLVQTVGTFVMKLPKGAGRVWTVFN